MKQLTAAAMIVGAMLGATGSAAASGALGIARADLHHAPVAIDVTQIRHSYHRRDRGLDPIVNSKKQFAKCRAYRKAHANRQGKRYAFDRPRGGRCYQGLPKFNHYYDGYPRKGTSYSR